MTRFLSRQIILLLFAPLFLNTCLRAQAKRLYIGHDDHTDYMWTANEAAYDSAFVKMLDYYLASIDSTKNEAPDFQTRFNCDGSSYCALTKSIEAKHSLTS